MIIDVPTGDDFISTGIDFLNLAWSTIIDLFEDLKEAEDFHDYYHAENLETANPLPLDKYWEKAQRTLGTTLSLIQQGTEFLLKGHIATVSPYLLISGDPGSYPKESHKRDVRFSEFKTIDAQDLIRAYNTVSPSRLPDDFRKKFDDLRSQRNTVMHTVDPSLRINSNELFVDILEICHHLIAPESWIENRRKFIENKSRPIILGLNDYMDYDYTIDKLSFEINLVIGLLQPSEARKYFKFEKKPRSYICPNCYSEAFREKYAKMGSMEEIPRLAQLAPNEPTSSNVYCIVCNKSSLVTREDCATEGCQGNVIDNDFYFICLTCGL